MASPVCWKWYHSLTSDSNDFSSHFTISHMLPSWAAADKLCRSRRSAARMEDFTPFHLLLLLPPNVIFVKGHQDKYWGAYGSGNSLDCWAKFQIDSAIFGSWVLVGYGGAGGILLGNFTWILGCQAWLWQLVVTWKGATGNDILHLFRNCQQLNGKTIGIPAIPRDDWCHVQIFLRSVILSPNGGIFSKYYFKRLFSSLHPQQRNGRGLAVLWKLYILQAL